MTTPRTDVLHQQFAGQSLRRAALGALAAACFVGGILLSMRAHR
ncbi:hypothetical protein [Methylibium rhizosphaerae]|jgi:hypothetical protein|nr:hypothetical protein [Methylibium rhizosphaerae]